jgi:hypothetical protein
MVALASQIHADRTIRNMNIVKIRVGSFEQSSIADDPEARD